MPSIFDPPAGARTFNASDWLTALDVQVRTPPSPPPIDEEPIIAESPSYRVRPDDETTTEDRGPWEATQPAAARRRLRNTPWAIVATCAAGVYIMLVVGTFGGPAWLLWAALAVCALEFVLWLILAWRFGKL